MGRLIRAVAIAALVVSSSGCTVWLARVSHHDAGGADGGTASGPTVSADGRYVAFLSTASGGSVWRRDLHTGTTERVDVLPGGGGIPGAEASVSISGDGGRASFTSSAPGIVDGDDNGATDVFVRDLDAGTTTLVSAALDGGVASGPSAGGQLSDDGRFVAFWSEADDIVDEELVVPPGYLTTGFGYVRDLDAGTTTLVSVLPDGTPVPGHATDVSDGGHRAVFFHLREAGTYFGDVWVRDLDAGTTILASESVDGDVDYGDHYGGILSADGDVVAFTSDHSLEVPGQPFGPTEAHVRDLVTGTVRSSGCSETGALNGLSADGRLVFFTCDAPLYPGDGDDGDLGDFDAYAWDRITGQQLRLEQSPHITGTSWTLEYGVSADGLTYAFASPSHLDPSLPDDGQLRVFASAVVPTGPPVSAGTVARGTTVSFTIRGIGFAEDMGVDTARTTGPHPRTDDGITVADVDVVSPYEATVELVVDADAPVGERFFVLTNPPASPAVGTATVGSAPAPSVT